MKPPKQQENSECCNAPEIEGKLASFTDNYSWTSNRASLCSSCAKPFYQKSYAPSKEEEKCEEGCGDRYGGKCGFPPQEGRKCPQCGFPQAEWFEWKYDTHPEAWEEELEKMFDFKEPTILHNIPGLPTKITFKLDGLKSFIRSELQSAREEERSKTIDESAEITKSCMNEARQSERERIRQRVEKLGETLLFDQPNKKTYLKDCQVYDDILQSLQDKHK